MLKQFAHVDTKRQTSIQTYIHTCIHTYMHTYVLHTYITCIRTRTIFVKQFKKTRRVPGFKSKQTSISCRQSPLFPHFS